MQITLSRKEHFQKEKIYIVFIKQQKVQKLRFFYVSMNAISVESLKCNVLKAYCSLQNETKRNGTKRNENL